MTTNLHDKMLAAIDALFSASNAVEEEEAENLLLDVLVDFISHKRAEKFCDSHCTWLDHHPDCDKAEQPRAEGTLAQQSAERGEPCGWQFYQDGKWHNGMEFNDHRKHTEAAGLPVRDLYPPPPAPAHEPLTDEESSKMFDSLIDEMLDHSYQGSHDSAEKAANEIRRMYKAAHGITSGEATTKGELK